jgi:hypothetical protein
VVINSQIYITATVSLFRSANASYVFPSASVSTTGVVLKPSPNRQTINMNRDFANLRSENRSANSNKNRPIVLKLRCTSFFFIIRNVISRNINLNTPFGISFNSANEAFPIIRAFPSNVPRITSFPSYFRNRQGCRSNSS